jgi:hypothetical protein
MSGRDPASIKINTALQQTNFAEFTKYVSEAINLMQYKESENFFSDTFDLKYSDNSNIFCKVATNLKNKLKNYITNSSVIESQLDSFISHAQKKFPIKPTTSNDQKENVSNIQFNKQTQKSPKFSDHSSKHDIQRSNPLSSKEAHSEPIQPSNFK